MSLAVLVEGALLDVRVRRLIGVGGDSAEGRWGLWWWLLKLEGILENTVKKKNVNRLSDGVLKK